MPSALGSGFMNRDYILSFAVVDDVRRRALVELCEDLWQGELVAGDTWEISSDLGPGALEEKLMSVLGPGDRAVYYYLSDAKRIFRVVIEA